MATVSLEGQYLGHSSGEFTDKQTGEVIRYGSVWLWDPDGIQAIQLKKDRAYPVEQMNADLQGVKYGDRVKAQATIRAAQAIVEYKLSRIAKVKE